jgi:hypothetical protein
MHFKMKNLLLFVSLFVLSIGIFPHLTFAQTDPNAIVEDSVRFYFADAPIMIDVARCETKFKQYTPDGSAYYDGTHTYIGVFQINEKIHTPRALGMGLNIATLDGNLAYARYLYNTSGTNPWKGCLPKTITATAAPTASALPVATGAITSNLNIGMTNPQIVYVQQILNKNGFTISATGPGSPGHETNYFGSLTREAVKRFQCAKQITCSGNESTTGYGRVGPATRAALNN